MFELSGSVTLTHVNVRKGTAEDASVSVDLQFKASDVPCSTAAAALGIESPDELKAAFFLPLSVDANESARFTNLKHAQCETGWDGKHALKLEGQRKLRVTRVGKVKLRPRQAGRFDMQFTVSISEPEAGFIENVAEHLNQPVKIGLEQDPELDLSAKVTKPNAAQGELPGTTAPARSSRKARTSKATKKRKAA